MGRRNLNLRSSAGLFLDSDIEECGHANDGTGKEESGHTTELGPLSPTKNAKRMMMMGLDSEL